MKLRAMIATDMPAYEGKLVYFLKTLWRTGHSVSETAF